MFARWRWAIWAIASERKGDDFEHIEEQVAHCIASVHIDWDRTKLRLIHMVDCYVLQVRSDKGHERENGQRTHGAFRFFSI